MAAFIWSTKAAGRVGVGASLVLVFPSASWENSLDGEVAKLRLATYLNLSLTAP